MTNRNRPHEAELSAKVRQLEAENTKLKVELMRKQNDLDAYRRAATSLRHAWDQYAVCADDFGALGALDACIEQQEALDRAIAGVIDLEITREDATRRATRGQDER